VTVKDNFWTPVMERMRSRVIPYQWEALNDRIPGTEPSYSMRNFKAAAQRTCTGLDYGIDKTEGHKGPVFTDSDFGRWLEGAAYTLTWKGDPELEKTIDGAIEIVCEAQQPDGYLNSYYINTGLEKRFTNLKDNHELYCLGHLIEAAVAYFEVTEKRRLLDALLGYVDCVDRLIGPEDGKLHGYPGCQTLEFALVKLYGITGDQKHLRLAKYFIDQRGQSPLYFEEETKKHGNPSFWEDSYVKYQYYQAGKPVRDQHIAEGHAVRAVYLYTAMADIAKLYRDDALLKACENIWDNIVKRQMYITGAIGQQEHGEAFTFDYDLPNDTVYAETCAAVGLAFFAKRMAAIRPRGAYGDILEKVLFNGILSGISLDGTRFFYVNPQEVFPEALEKSWIYRHVKGVRQPWFACCCCPPNVVRIVSSLGSYIHSVNENAVYTHLFIGSESKARVRGKDIVIQMETAYPWEETVTIKFGFEGKLNFRYAFRIPSWCSGYSIRLNGRPVDAVCEDGFAVIEREWSEEDRIAVNFDMPVTVMEANPRVRENIGKAAVMRGPVVYCLEEADNGRDLFKIRLGENPVFSFKYEKDTLGGVVTLSSTGKRQKDWDEDTLYRQNTKALFESVDLRWIPYFGWANREPGEMIAWVHK
jgi:DUF1680 family protein